MAKIVIYRHREQGRLTNGSFSTPVSSKWDPILKNEVHHYPYFAKRRLPKFNAPHLHILVEIPDDRSIVDVREFVSNFCAKPRKDYSSDRWLTNTMQSFYVEPAADVLASRAAPDLSESFVVPKSAWK